MKRAKGKDMEKRGVLVLNFFRNKPAREAARHIPTSLSIFDQHDPSFTRLGVHHDISPASRRQDESRLVVLRGAGKGKASRSR